MPTNRYRRRRERSEYWSDEWTQSLVSDNGIHHFLSQNPDDVLEEAKAAWAERREELLPAFIFDSPGKRPWAWWEFDRPEDRRIVSGGGSIERRPGDWYHDSAPWGAPRLWYGSNPDEIKATFETELEYLTRLKLLKRDERSALRKLKGATL